MTTLLPVEWPLVGLSGGVMVAIVRRAWKSAHGFNMIELMVVVVIVGILSSIAVPIYTNFVRKSRVAEATDRMGEMLAAARLYAVDHESNGNASDADWPTNCNEGGFIANCDSSPHFDYSLNGRRHGALVITATGRHGTSMEKMKLVLVSYDPEDTASITITKD